MRYNTTKYNTIQLNTKLLEKSKETFGKQFITPIIQHNNEFNQPYEKGLLWPNIIFPATTVYLESATQRNL